MAIVEPSPGIALTAPDPLAVALGLVNWNANWGTFTSTLAPTSQTIFATAIWLPFGRPITRLSTLCTVAASGTAITGGFMGLCSPTTMVAQSANIGTAAASYPVGPLVVPFAGSVLTYSPNATDSATGIYYVLVLLNGTFGTTQPTFARGNGTGAAGLSPSGGTLIQFGNAGTGVATLPANAAAVTLTAAGQTPFAVGCAP